MVMASIFTLWLREQLRLIKPIVSRASIETARQAQDMAGELGSRMVASRVTVEEIAFDRFKAAVVIPNDCADSDHVILYLHGGGYVAGSLPYALGFGSVLAVRTGLSTLCAAYRLAPEHPYPAAVEDACTAYKCLLVSGIAAENITLFGESAGGGLAYALCLWLRERGIALPGRIVAISPWADLTFSGKSYRENYLKDPSLSEEALRYYAEIYAGRNVREPCVSPVMGDLYRFPPSLIYAGSDEILRDDAVMLKERLEECSSEVRLHIAEGLWHVYVLFWVPEAQEALDEIAEFVKP